MADDDFDAYQPNPLPEDDSVITALDEKGEAVVMSVKNRKEWKPWDPKRKYGSNNNKKEEEDNKEEEERKKRQKLSKTEKRVQAVEKTQKRKEAKAIAEERIKATAFRDKATERENKRKTASAAAVLPSNWKKWGLTAVASSSSFVAVGVVGSPEKETRLKKKYAPTTLDGHIQSNKPPRPLSPPLPPQYASSMFEYDNEEEEAPPVPQMNEKENESEEKRMDERWHSSKLNLTKERIDELETEITRFGFTYKAPVTKHEEEIRKRLARFIEQHYWLPSDFDNQPMFGCLQQHRLPRYERVLFIHKHELCLPKHHPLPRFTDMRYAPILQLFNDNKEQPLCLKGYNSTDYKRTRIVYETKWLRPLLLYLGWLEQFNLVRTCRSFRDQFQGRLKRFVQPLNEEPCRQLLSAQHRCFLFTALRLLMHALPFELCTFTKEGKNCCIDYVWHYLVRKRSILDPPPDANIKILTKETLSKKMKNLKLPKLPRTMFGESTVENMINTKEALHAAVSMFRFYSWLFVKEEEGASVCGIQEADLTSVQYERFYSILPAARHKPKKRTTKNQTAAKTVVRRVYSIDDWDADLAYWMLSIREIIRPNVEEFTMWYEKQTNSIYGIVNYRPDYTFYPFRISCADRTMFLCTAHATDAASDPDSGSALLLNVIKIMGGIELSSNERTVLSKHHSFLFDVLSSDLYLNILSIVRDQFTKKKK